jgi:hypothetical protein
VSISHHPSPGAAVCFDRLPSTLDFLEPHLQNRAALFLTARQTQRDTYPHSHGAKTYSTAWKSVKHGIDLCPLVIVQILQNRFSMAASIAHRNQ